MEEAVKVLAAGNQTSVQQKVQAIKTLQQQLVPFGDFVYRMSKTMPQTTAAMMSSLILFADTLDEMGEHEQANSIDDMLRTAEKSTIKLGPGTVTIDVTPDMWENLQNAVRKNWQYITEILTKINEMGQHMPYYSGKSASGTNELVKLANYLNESGFHKLADKVDKELEQSEYGFFPRERKPQEEEETVEPVQPPRLGSLSTRYCPDHIGVQSVRISDRTYQCPIDGRVYNYESGYKNYQGQRVPGGSVAAQTPTTSNYGGIPMRIYDSRQSVLNRVN
jgi:hypothetical protein